MNEHRVRRRGKRGVILLVVAGLMFVLLAFVGLAFDAGYLQWSRRRAQTAADAAALAGAWAVQIGGSVTAEGQNSSKVNGFEDGRNAVTVTINKPPTIGSYTSDPSAVEAIVSQDAPAFFMRILGFNTLPVRARAVARKGLGTGCVYVLNPGIKSALKFAGNSNVTMGCGAIVESNNSEATTLDGTTTVTLTNGASIGSVGGYKCGGAGDPAPCTLATPSYGVYKGAVSPGDPLATTLTMPQPPATPTDAACFDGTTMRSGATCAGPTNAVDGTVFSPGVYCGGINVNNGVNVTFSAGTYIIVGGIGLNFSNGTVTGTGVTFYMTALDDAPSGWPCTGLNGNSGYPGPVSITTAATVTLSPPTCDCDTAGVYCGITFFQNRGIPANHLSNNLINGGVGTVLNGAIYFPHSALSFSGGGDSTGYQMIIADTLDFVGGTILAPNNFPSCYGSGSTNPAFKKWAVMAE
jgi:hypothetical protein